MSDDGVRRVEQEHRVDRAIDRAEVKRVASGARRRSLGRLAAFLLIVFISAFGFYQQDQFNESRCVASRDNRIVQKDIVLAIYNLALGVTTPPVGEPPPKITPQEQRELDLYIERVETFRKDAMQKIKPSPACDKYEIPENIDSPKEGTNDG